MEKSILEQSYAGFGYAVPTGTQSKPFDFPNILTQRDNKFSVLFQVRLGSKGARAIDDFQTELAALFTEAVAPGGVSFSVNASQGEIIGTFDVRDRKAVMDAVWGLNKSLYIRHATVKTAPKPKKSHEGFYASGRHPSASYDSFYWGIR